MGRNAKLRRERKAASGDSNRPAKSPRRGRKTEFRLDLPALDFDDTPPKLSWFGRLMQRFRPGAAPAPEKPQRAEILVDRYARELAGLAWAGYQKEGRGAVMAVDLGGETISVAYVPRRLLQQYLPAREASQVASKLVEAYDPETGLAIAYLRDGEVGMATIADLDPPPPQCPWPIDAAGSSEEGSGIQTAIDESDIPDLDVPDLDVPDSGVENAENPDPDGENSSEENSSEENSDGESANRDPSGDVAAESLEEDEANASNPLA